MAQTKTQIISNALSILGKKVTLSLVAQNELVTAAEQSFDSIFPDRISKHFWRFSTRIVQLSQLNQTPIGGYWLYAYQLPGDYLQLIHLWPQMYNWELYENGLLYTNFNAAASQNVLVSNIAITGINIPSSYLNLSSPLPQNEVFAVQFLTTGTLPTTSPQISAGVTYYINPITPTQVRVFSNSNDAQANINYFTVSSLGNNSSMNVQSFESSQSQGLYLEYQFLPLIQNLPPYFTRALYYEIAAELALVNAQSVQYYQPLQARADYLWQCAQAKDAQNRPQTQLQNAPMISRRFVSVFVSG